jgi:hypothetical protein
VSQVTVHYERKFSDGNYGSEGLSLSWTVDDADLAAGERIAATLRTAVLRQLARSAARPVAYSARQELDGPRPEPVPATVADSTDMEDLPF